MGTFDQGTPYGKTPLRDLRQTMPAISSATITERSSNLFRRSLAFVGRLLNSASVEQRLASGKFFQKMKGQALTLDMVLLDGPDLRVHHDPQEYSQWTQCAWPSPANKCSSKSVMRWEISAQVY